MSVISWVTPRTFVAAAVLTAAQLNETRDNLNALTTYTAYTPALTATTTNPTLGTGSSATGIGCLQGGTNSHGDIEGKITFGTSGTSAGSGFYRISTPFTIAPNTAEQPIGEAVMFDSSANTYSRGVCWYIGATTFGVNIFVASGTAAAVVALSATAPFAWGASDYISFKVRTRCSP